MLRPAFTRLILRRKEIQPWAFDISRPRFAVTDEDFVDPILIQIGGPDSVSLLHRVFNHRSLEWQFSVAASGINGDTRPMHRFYRCQESPPALQFSLLDFTRSAQLGFVRDGTRSELGQLEGLALLLNQRNPFLTGGNGVEFSVTIPVGVEMVMHPVQRFVEFLEQPPVRFWSRRDRECEQTNPRLPVDTPV